MNSKGYRVIAILSVIVVFTALIFMHYTTVGRPLNTSFGYKDDGFSTAQKQHQFEYGRGVETGNQNIRNGSPDTQEESQSEHGGGVETGNQNIRNGSPDTQKENQSGHGGVVETGNQNIRNGFPDTQDENQSGHGGEVETGNQNIRKGSPDTQKETPSGHGRGVETGNQNIRNGSPDTQKGNHSEDGGVETGNQNIRNSSSDTQKGNHSEDGGVETGNQTIRNSSSDTQKVNQSGHGGELETGKRLQQTGFLSRMKQEGSPNLAVVACGNKMIDEALTLIKSAVLFTKTFLVLHVVVDSKQLEGIYKDEFNSWPSDVRARMEYNIVNATFPADTQTKNESWRSLFKPCASQRIFFADLFPDVDSVIYVDVDALFLAPIEELWSNFYKFNSTQYLGIAPDSDLPNRGTYTESDIPNYGINGINTGVLLMNLTRIRRSTWVQKLTETLVNEDRKRLKFGDNDLIQIFLHNNPEFGYMLTCDWNHHVWQCIKCDQSQKTGVALLHGCMDAFTNNNTIPFKAVYLAFTQFKLGNHSIQYDLLPSIKQNLDAVKGQKSEFPVDCHQNPSVYTTRIETMITPEKLT